MVTPDMESAASSLLEMSNNAAARARSSSSSTIAQPVSSKPKIQVIDSARKPQVCSASAGVKSNSPAGTVPSNKSAAKVQSSIANPRVQWNSSAFGESSSVHVETSSYIDIAKTKSDSTERSSVSTLRLQTETCSTDVTITYSISTGNQLQSSSAGDNSGQEQRNRSSTWPTTHYPQAASMFRYSSPRSDNHYQHQTVQNFCQNLYQGVNLYHSPMSPQIQRQHFSYVQPVMQQAPAISYPLPQVPYIPFQAGYPPIMTGQTQAWAYVPNMEHQYPINLSMQSQLTSSANTQADRHALNNSINLLAKPDESGIYEEQKVRLTQNQTGIKRRAHSVETDLNSNMNANPQGTNIPTEFRPKIKKAECDISDSSAGKPINIKEERNSCQSKVQTTDQSMKTSTTEATLLGLPKVSKSDLQALSDLTLGIGVDASTKESRIFLGTGMKAIKTLQDGQTSNVLSNLPSPDWSKLSRLMDNQNGVPEKSEQSSTQVTAITIAATLTPVSNRNEETIYIDTNRNGLSLTSFPYSQEIKLPDGQMSLIKLKGDCMSVANVAAKHGGGVNSIPNVTAGHSISSADLIIANNNPIEIQGQQRAKTVQELIQLRNARCQPHNSEEQIKGWENLLSTDSFQDSAKTFVESGNCKTETGKTSQQQDDALTENITGKLSDKDQEHVKELDSKLAYTEDKCFNNTEADASVKVTELLKHSYSGAMDCLNTEIPHHAKDAVKQRSKSDSACPFEQTFENTDFQIFPVENKQMSFRKRNFMSEGDCPIENVEDNQNDLAATSNDLVHVVDKDKVVTVKVAKYPELTIVPGRLAGRSRSGQAVMTKSVNTTEVGKKDQIKTQESPVQRVTVGKAPVIRSKIPETPSWLTVTERQYLEQIQQYPQNISQNSSLAQLLLKDSKCLRKSQNGNEIVIRQQPERKTGAAVIKILPEELEQNRLKLAWQHKSKRPSSNSNIPGHHSAHLDELMVNDKSTNTLQDDDDVFLQIEPLKDLNP